MTVLDDFRQKYPQYKDVPDVKLATAIRKKYYADMPATDFYRKTGLTHLVGISDQPENGLGSDAENFLAGMGKSVVDTARGLKQLGMAVSDPFGTQKALSPAYNAEAEQLKQDQSEAGARDAALMDTKAGFGGNLTGQALEALLGGVALKGAGVASSIVPTTYRGAALAGGAQGASQPLDATQGEGQRLLSTAVGAGAGVVGQAIPSAVGAGARTLRSLIDPVTDSGQDRIIANTYARFAQGGNMTPTASAVPGVQPTIAEATGNAGLGQLQNSIFESDPALMNQLAQRQAQNNAARIGLLKKVAGTQDQLDEAIARRDNVANLRYQQAFQDSESQQIARHASADSILADAEAQAEALRHSPATMATGRVAGARKASSLLDAADATASNVLKPSGRMVELAKRPAVQQAMKKAVVLAKNQGIDIGDPLASLRGQHYIKLALDDMLNTAQQQGMGKVEQNAIASTKSAFVSELERQNPAYRSARESFRDMSAPVNQLELGRGLLSRVTSQQADELGQVVDVMGNPVLTADKFGNAVKNLDAIAKNTTGQKRASASSLLSEQQKDAITTLLGDLSRVKASASAGKAAGSNTRQNLISQSLLDELTKATGIKGLQSNGIIARLVAPLDSAYKLFGAPDEIRGKLAQLALNPQSKESQAILARIPVKQRNAIERAIAPYTGFVGQEAGVGVGK